MNEGLTKVAYFRMNQLMALMVEAAEKRNKEELVPLLETFIEDAGDFLEVLRSEAQLSNEDLKKYAMSEEQAEALVQLASATAGYRLPVKTAKTEKSSELTKE